VELEIFDSEREAGLAPLLENENSNRILVAAAASRWESGIRTPAVASIQPPEQARASVNDIDLYFMKSVLVSTGWNANDDVFDPIEVWKARRTPEHKPFNLEHDCSNIIGHTISNWVIDAQGATIADETPPEQLPATLHVCNGDVLYKYWEKEELQERMNTIISEIEEGKWFVSMECLFSSFDYALVAPDGTQRVVKRNPQTAFLTKHLRAYEGSGMYNGYRVGRLPRNFVFSGKGLVRNPANTNSVIFSDTQPFSAQAAKKLEHFPEQVYTTASITHERKEMSIEIDTLKAELEQAKSQLKEATKTIETSDAARAKAEEQLKSAQSELATAKQEITALRESLASLEKEKRTVARLALVKELLSLESAEAAELVSINETTTDEAFKKQVELMAKAMERVKLPQPSTQVQTPAPNTPASTPTPQVAKADKLDIEKDAKGVQNAKASQLDNIQPTDSVTLNVSGSDVGVNTVAVAIASYLGRGE
jgi:hypothetical protein